MTATLPNKEQVPGAPRPRRRWIRITLGVIGGAIALFMIVSILAIAIFHAREGRPIPTFVSLAEHPDGSLQGTVAYYDSQSRCVRLVAAAGRPSKTLYCLPAESTSTWQELGKPAGPQLVWLPDGRLEVTMFRMTPGPGQKTPLVLKPGWQKIIDPHTGTVENVPAAKAPSTPNTTSEPTVSPGGQKVSYTLDGSSGKVEVILSDRSGTRTLLSAHGPGEYGYQFGPVFWAPNWKWIAAADDGRVLVITPTDPPVTRVLVTGSGGGAGGGTAGPSFAVTSENLLG